MTGHYKMNVEESEDSPLANMFDFSLISYAMTFMYHLITFVSLSVCALLKNFGNANHSVRRGHLLTCTTPNRTR